MQTSCRPADLHAPPHSSLVASPHESEGPFASSLWGQSWHGLPLRATPCSPQNFRSSTGWPALGLCRDPYTLWDPVPHSLIKHCWCTRVQHLLGLEPNITKYMSPDQCRHLGFQPIKMLLFVCLSVCLSVLLHSKSLLICVAVLLEGFSCSLVLPQNSAHTFCLAGTSLSTNRSSGCSAGTPYPHASKSFKTAILHTFRDC